MQKLTESQQKILRSVSADIGADADTLYKLIEFESGWSIYAKNPYSSAMGLLQFVDSTARDLGYNDAYDLVNSNPTIESQLTGPVYNYLKKYGPFPNDQSLYMAVFFPAAMNWPPNREFPDYVQKVNPGIRTVQDYINKVNRTVDKGGIFLAVAAIAGLLLYITIRG